MAGSTTRKKAIVVGGGIGGLTAALALQRAGIKVVVLERTGSLDQLTLGAGVHLWSNAIRALQQIDFADTVVKIGTEVNTHRYLTWRGTQLGLLRVNEFSAELGAPTVGLSRPELHRALVDALEPGVLRLGAEFIGFEQNTKRVVARMADGSSEQGDVLIGADGIKSMVRAQLHGQSQPHYSGNTAWRGIVDFTDPETPPGEMRIYWGPGARILHYHVSDQKLYWLALVKSPPRVQDPASGRKSAVLDVYQGWPDHIRRMLEATDESAILRTDIIDRDPLKHWGLDRVTLLGDAAHPMTPDMAQGAGQAIEDAVSLAAALVRTPDSVEALRDYEQRRISRANEFVKTSRIVSKMSLMDAPLLCTVRNQIVLRTVYAIQSAGKARKDLTPQL